MVKYGGNSSQGLAHVSSQQKHRAVPSQSSANSECLPRADTWVRPYDQIPTSCRNGFCSLGVEHRPFWPYKILANWAFLSCQVSLKYKAERK